MDSKSTTVQHVNLPVMEDKHHSYVGGGLLHFNRASHLVSLFQIALCEGLVA